MTLQSGTAVGPYVILELLGSGGMGAVYRASDPRLGREVAIKVIAGVEAPDEERRRRFEREARATAALSHPNILTVFDVGTHDGVPFLVTELLAGQTLRERLAAGPLDLTEAVALVLQLVRGVAAAHSLRIVHRDLKPENLFLTRDGTLKILDFGLAKLREGSVLAADATTLDASTPGRMFGTLAYMAPEQVRGQPVDERADLFAVGAILCEAVTGTHPFQGKTAADTAAAILRAEMPDLAAPGGGAAPLARLIGHCLEKDPADRFQSAGDLAFALETALGDLERPAARPEAPRERAPLASIAVLPFADMSPTRDQDYFCEGIAEELLNALTRIEGLRVAARSSSFQFRGTAADIRAIGARLGVDAVLEGSVRKAGERLRVNVQLVDVADGYHRWSERFDRQLEDVFTIQDEIAECVATALRGVLSPREREALHRPETEVECYEYFLRGRRLVHKFSRTDLDLARRMFERAIELDPEYAPAFAGLADVHSWFYEWWGGDERDLDAADRASRRALELAPELAEAHASRGFVLSLRRRYAEAERAYQEAIRRNPQSYDAHYYYGRTCFAWGELERSAQLFRRAGELRQEDFQSLILLGQSLAALGRPEEALEANREGVRRAERRLELDPADSRALSLGANALMVDGQRERALVWSRRALELYPEDQSVCINGACLRARLGLKEEALELLERTFAKGFGKRDWIEHDPDYDSIRDDPRFQAMLEKLH